MANEDMKDVWEGNADLWVRLSPVFDSVFEPVTAALTAALSLGALTEAQAAAAVAVDRTFVPDPSTHAAYERPYRGFVSMYKRHKGLNAALRP